MCVAMSTQASGLTAMGGNTMDTALVRCALLRHPPAYRGSPRLSEALDLLEINDYHEMLQRRSKLIPGKLTWARVAGVAVSVAAKALLLGDADRAVSYVEDVRALADRLRDRDAHPTARVTTQLRAQIGQLLAFAECISAVVALRDGKAATDASMGKLTALRTRFYVLRGEHPSIHGEWQWAEELVQTAAGRVLTSDAGAGAKAVAARAVAAWLPVAASRTPLHTPLHAPSHALSRTPSHTATLASPMASNAPPPTGVPLLVPPLPRDQPSQRFKISGEGPGVQLAWTDEDDRLS